MHNIGLSSLLSRYIAVLRELRPYGIESPADVAEYLFEQALGGKRTKRGKKRHDIVVNKLGRVQVKARCLPSDGRKERRLHLGNMNRSSCDYLGAVIFTCDLHVHRAVLVPADAVWRLIEEHTDPEKKVQFDLLAALPRSVEMTERLAMILDRQERREGAGDVASDSLPREDM